MLTRNLVFILSLFTAFSASATTCLDSPAAEKAAAEYLLEEVPAGFTHSSKSSSLDNEAEVTIRGMFRDGNLVYMYSVDVECYADGTAEVVSGGFSAKNINYIQNAKAKRTQD